MKILNIPIGSQVAFTVMINEDVALRMGYYKGISNFYVEINAINSIEVPVATNIVTVIPLSFVLGAQYLAPEHFSDLFWESALTSFNASLPALLHWGGGAPVYDTDDEDDEFPENLPEQPNNAKKDKEDEKW